MTPAPVSWQPAGPRAVPARESILQQGMDVPCVRPRLAADEAASLREMPLRTTLTTGFYIPDRRGVPPHLVCAVPTLLPPAKTQQINGLSGPRAVKFSAMICKPVSTRGGSNEQRTNI